MNWNDWCERVTRHDFSYAYSDDHRVYMHGNYEDKLLRQAAKQFPAEDVKRVWNGVIDTKFLEDYRHQFYWRD